MNNSVKGEDIFKFIEQNFDLEKFSLRGINFWPLMRSRIAYYLYFEIPKSDLKVIERRRSFTDVLKTPIRNFKIARNKKRFHSSLNPLKEEFQVCTYPNKLFIDSFTGKKYNRYVDPYYELLREMNFNAGRFSFSTEQDELKDPYLPVTYCRLDDFIKYMEQKKYLESFDANVVRESNDLRSAFAAANSLTEAEFNMKPFYNTLIAEFYEVVFYKEYFKALLSRSKVKYIFLDGFDGALKMAMCAASKEYNIKVIEIQHGIINNNYLPYLNHNITYSIMPDYLWCWSENDKEKIIIANGQFKYFKPFTGGNMWLKKFVKGEIRSVTDEEEKFFAATRTKYKKLIVFTHQPLLSAECIYETISKAPKDYLFFIRFHPLAEEKEKKEILQKLSKFENIETNKASKVNLFALYKYCDMQLTYSSTTAMEALVFNLPTIVCSKIAYKFYKEYIDAKVIFYSESGEDILDMITSGKKPDAANLDRFLIKVDTKKAIENLNAVLTESSA